MDVGITSPRTRARTRSCAWAHGAIPAKEFTFSQISLFETSGTSPPGRGRHTRTGLSGPETLRNGVNQIRLQGHPLLERHIRQSTRGGGHDEYISAAGDTQSSGRTVPQTTRTLRPRVRGGLHRDLLLQNVRGGGEKELRLETSDDTCSDGGPRPAPGVLSRGLNVPELFQGLALQNQSFPTHPRKNTSLNTPKRGQLTNG